MLNIRGTKQRDFTTYDIDFLFGFGVSRMLRSRRAFLYVHYKLPQYLNLTNYDLSYTSIIPFKYLRMRANHMIASLIASRTGYPMKVIEDILYEFGWALKVFSLAKLTGLRDGTKNKDQGIDVFGMKLYERDGKIEIVPMRKTYRLIRLMLSYIYHLGVKNRDEKIMFLRSSMNDYGI